MATAKQEAEYEVREEADGSVTINPGDEDDDDDNADPAGVGAVGVNDDDDDDEAGERTAKVTDDDAAADDADVPGADNSVSAKRARRRQERLDRKNRARDREDGLRRELGARDTVISQLNDRLNLLERKSTGSDLAALDSNIATAAQGLEQLQGVIDTAVTKADGKTAAEATRQMMQLQQQHDGLVRVRQAHTAQGQRPMAADPVMLSQANAWVARNAWYKPANPDMDSRIAHQIETVLASEAGQNPQTPEYWAELDKRIAQYLPHRAQKGATLPASQAGKKPVRTPVSGSGRESAAQGGAGTGHGGGSFTLSSERVQALKDAGMWNDPKQRTEAIKRFRDFDRNASRSNNS